MAVSEILQDYADQLDLNCIACFAIPVNDRKAQDIRRENVLFFDNIQPLCRAAGVDHKNTGKVLFRACSDCNKGGRQKATLALGMQTNAIRLLAAEARKKGK